MSSTTRTTIKGGKTTKADPTKTQKSDRIDSQKLEKNKTGKASVDKNQSQHSSDTIRNAKYKDLRTEDPSMKEKVCALIELTQRSEEDVCLALHECGFDSNLAGNMLLESSDQEWVTSVKKKKNRQAGSKTEGGTVEGASDEWQETTPVQNNDREKSRTRGGPPRMRGRGWRGRENRENEKNLEGGIEGGRRGRMSNGPARGGGSGRGGRGGGRLGSRTFQSRDGGGGRNSNRQPMETWNSTTATQPEPENWDNDFPSPIDDWYNEEYTGSLADTKVFTPSTLPDPEEPQQPPEEILAPQTTALTPAQSQYLSQLTQQNADNKEYGAMEQVQQAPRVKTQRARVPPPSKIPQSAVEMPGDLNSTVGYLDVQFGALDFMDSTSFDPADKFPPSDPPPAAPASAPSDLAPQAPAVSPQVSISATLSLAETIPAAELSYARPGAQPPVSAPQMDISKDVGHTYVTTQQNSYQSYQKTNNSVYQSQNYTTNNFQTNSQVTSASSYASTQSTPSYSTSYTPTTYQNSYSSTYPSTPTFPTLPTPTPTTYQPTYGTLNTSYTNNTQYNNYNHKKESYETTASVALTTTTTTSTAKPGAKVVAGIPPGVAPMMGTQYIMGQGMPYFQQPMYSYEDLQLLQQRVPPHMGAYYDIGYQTPTTLAGGRDASITTGTYSISDTRFPRDTSSPVPSTLSQQTSTQSHQAQPMLSATLPPGYAYFYNAAGMMPGSFQYGTPAIYPQMPAATNAHGTSQYPKPSSYGSGYASGYDALTQGQEYGKGGYGAQQKAGASAVTTGSSAVTDLSVMYGKSHAALGKVNSYEKQGFHSGTPPPFNLAGSQSAGLAPSGTYGPQMYIPTMPGQHHHTSTLMHQPLHQDSGNSSGQRSQSSSQAKTGAQKTYPNSYWNPA